MSPIDNKTIARRSIEEVWNAGKLDVLNEICTSNCTLEDPHFPIEGKGPEAVKKYATAIRTAFPDFNVRIDDIIAEGDKVVTFMHNSGTQEGEFLGVPASHNKATVPGVCLQRFENGKIAQIYNFWDAAGFMHAAGVLEKTRETAYTPR